MKWLVLIVTSKQMHDELDYSAYNTTLTTEN